MDKHLEECSREELVESLKVMTAKRGDFIRRDLSGKLNAHERGYYKEILDEMNQVIDALESFLSGYSYAWPEVKYPCAVCGLPRCNH